MQILLSLTILALACSAAVAGRNADGAMVVHVSNTIGSCGSSDLCRQPPLPNTCQDLATRINDPDADNIIWVVGAFPSSSSPGVTAYQFGVYGDVPSDYFTAWWACSSLPEAPDATWPGPGTGTRVSLEQPLYSRLFKMYWFCAGAPFVGAELRIGPYPHGSQQAEWTDDSDPPVVDTCNLFGTVQWGADGHNDCPGVMDAGDGAPRFATAIESVSPNPTIERAEIIFSLSEAAARGLTRLEVFDLVGRRVATLIDSHLAAGVHRSSFDRVSIGPRIKGAGIKGGGIYFVRLTTNEGPRSAKLVILD